MLTSFFDRAAQPGGIFYINPMEFVIEADYNSIEGDKGTAILNLDRDFFSAYRSEEAGGIEWSILISSSAVFWMW